MTGIELITEERREQIEKHGFSVDRDVAYSKYNQLIDAAINLLKDKPSPRDHPSFWPPEYWNRLISKPYRDRLVIAGALIAAELDRMEAAGEQN